MEKGVETVEISANQFELIPGDSEKLNQASKWGAVHKILPIPQFNLLVILAENQIIYRKPDGKFEVFEIPPSDFGVLEDTTVRIIEASVIEGTSTLVLRVGVGFHRDEDGHNVPDRVQIAGFDLSTFKLSQINELDIYNQVSGIRGSYAFVRNEEGTLSLVDMRTWTEIPLPEYDQGLELYCHPKKLIGNMLVEGAHVNNKEICVYNFEGKLEAKHQVSINYNTWSFIIPSPNGTSFFVLCCGQNGFWKIGNNTEAYARNNAGPLWWNLGNISPDDNYVAYISREDSIFYIYRSSDMTPVVKRENAEQGWEQLYQHFAFDANSQYAIIAVKEESCAEVISLKPGPQQFKPVKQFKLPEGHFFTRMWIDEAINTFNGVGHNEGTTHFYVTVPFGLN